MLETLYLYSSSQVNYSLLNKLQTNFSNIFSKIYCLRHFIISYSNVVTFNCKVVIQNVKYFLKFNNIKRKCNIQFHLEIVTFRSSKISFIYGKSRTHKESRKGTISKCPTFSSLVSLLRLFVVWFWNNHWIPSQFVIVKQLLDFVQISLRSKH